MRILIFGGSKFLGRHVVEAALKRGHEVTLINRGQTNPDLFPDVEKLRANRDGELDQVLQGRHFDVAIDTSGYVPRVVRQSVEKLKHSVSHYTFVSSISVYDDFSTLGLNEQSSILRLEDESSEDISQFYGALKALCEKEVQAVFEERALVIRPGLIVGPHDPTDRFTYWPHRFARGGSVLVPGKPENRVQFIDVRDLAEWMVELSERQIGGVFNATGPELPLTMGDFVNTCMRLVGTEVDPIWVDDEFLLDQQVQEWIELPLWISEKTNWPGLMASDFSQAMKFGLRFRPLEETIQTTLDWSLTLDPNRDWRAGLSPQREVELLTLWSEIAKNR